MVADETALVVALPDDDVAALQQKVLQASARWVQLLVPEGVVSLQQPTATAQLAQAALGAGIDLVLISADDPTLQAARASGVLTMQVRGARVLPPPRPAAPPAPAAPAAPAAPVAPPVEFPFATRMLDREPRDVATSNLARDLSAGDAAFLDALDDLDAAPARRTEPEDNDQTVDALISLYNADQRYAKQVEARPDRLRQQANAEIDDDIAAALDSIDLESAPPARAPAMPQPRRIRPEDIELTDDDRQRMGGRRPAPAPRAAAPSVRRERDYDAGRPPVDPSPQRAAAGPRRRGLPGWLIPLVLILLLLTIAAVLWLNQSNGQLPSLPGVPTAIISVSLPPVSGAVEPVSALAVPLVEPGAAQPPAAEAGPTAIEAAVLPRDVSTSAQGEVLEGTLAPSGTAAGVVTVLSLNNQAIPLPAGTEFVALKADGQEVPFVSSADVVVPPATTADQGAQIVTTRGQVDVSVSARSPGSASNVDANSIRRMTLPGGASFAVDSTTSLLVRHDQLTGGSESEVRVVKDADVQRALAGALTQLDADARQQLQELAAARGLVLEETTILPRRSELEQRQGFELDLQPGLGQTLDPANPRFALTVRARYSALSTPAGRTLSDQLGQVFTEQLRRAGRLQSGDCRAPSVTGVRWDGATLFVDGTIGPDPRCGNGLDPAAEQQVKDAVRGKPRVEATAALQALVDAGVIGSYSLPRELETVPDTDWNIRVSVQ